MAPRPPPITRVKCRIAMAGRPTHWLDTMIVIPTHVAGMRIDASRVVDKSIIRNPVADPSVIQDGG
jgi:hypothetical protein